MTPSEADEKSTAALEPVSKDGDLVRTEVLDGELLDVAPAPGPASGDSLFESAVTSTPDRAAAEGPTIRWGALVWALLFGAIAAFVLWILVDPARREAAVWWVVGLQPTMIVLYGLLALGIIVALFGGVGLIRRGERRRRAARG